MRKAYIEVWDNKEKRLVGYKLEQNDRINLEKMLNEYTTDIFAKYPAHFSEGERSCLIFVTDDGENVEIYQGDLKKFQDNRLWGLNHIYLTKAQVDLLKNKM